MKKALLLLLTSILGICSVNAGPLLEDVDSTLFSYYQWCNINRQDPNVLLKADTLLHLSVEKNDVRMQCVAMQFKADYYYFTNNLDSLKAWIPRVQDFSRERGQLKYYYFTWSRLILYYTKQAQFTLAQYELERYLAQAKADDYKQGTADAYIQLAHLFRTKSLTQVAAEYYRKAIDLIEQNNLDKFGLSTHYSALAVMLMTQQEYDQALAAIEKGKQSIVISSQIWELKALEARLYVLTHQIDKAKVLLREIKEFGGQNIKEVRILEIELSLYKENSQFAKALATINTIIEYHKKTESAESYYSHLYDDRAALLAKLGLFEAAYNDQKNYADIYRQSTTNQNESTLEEFATLLDVNRLDREKEQLVQQAQIGRLRFTQLIVWGLGIVLLLAGVFIAVQIRTNRKLKRAMLAAEESNRMKSIFIRTVTHEINTPLNAIVGFSEMAATHAETDDERVSYIQIVRQNSTQLQRLVDDVLYVADLEAMNGMPALAPLEINACCRECITKVLSLCPENVAIRFEPAQEQFTTATSQLFLTKLFNELLVNAIRFTTAGEIVLSYTVSELRRELVFAVTDTGCGIPVAERERIFERFVKLDTFSNGLGLGLSVCRSIANSLGGTLQLDTSYTKGARFVVTIPLC